MCCSRSSSFLIHSPRLSQSSITLFQSDWSSKTSPRHALPARQDGMLHFHCGPPRHPLHALPVSQDGMLHYHCGSLRHPLHALPARHDGMLHFHCGSLRLLHLQISFQILQARPKASENSVMLPAELEARMPRDRRKKIALEGNESWTPPTV